MVMGSTTDVGLDTSKKSIQVAMLLPGRREAVEWELANEPAAVKRLAKRLLREAVGELRVCYEAGPCGYTLQRQLRAANVDSIVVAPSLVPVKPGERIKTNRRDARKLAQALRADGLTEVHPPTPEEEAVRDLSRCREDAREDLLRARHRLGKMLLRRGLVNCGKAWTQAHRHWLRSLSFEHEADRAVFGDYLQAIEHLEERLRGLDEKLVTVSEKDPYREPVGWLRCFRGIDTLTAMTLVAELHDFRRFESPRGLMAFLGLVPSENSTGDKHRRGPITKAGNTHARRVLIEASWHYRHRPGVSKQLRKRREGQPGWVIGLADRAQLRLHKRFWKLALHGKSSNKAVTAVARELAGFVWAALSLKDAAAMPNNAIVGSHA
jgi:transposase